MFKVVIGSHPDCKFSAVGCHTDCCAVIGSRTDYQLPHCLQSVLVFNSKLFFLYLITSAQRLGSQRGVQMEVLRDKYLIIHTFLNLFFQILVRINKVKMRIQQKKSVVRCG